MAGDTINKIADGLFFSAVIQGQTVTVELPQQVEPALSGLRAGSPAWTGREADLRELLEILAPCQQPESQQAPASRAARMVLVTGMPGVGKTELAVHAAHTALRNGWFRGGVLFTDLHGYDPDLYRKPARALDSLLRALGMPGENIPAEEEDRVRLYRSVLARYAEVGRPILVIIDNVYGIDQVEPLLPSDGVTGAIVTSRETMGLDIKLRELDVLTLPDAVDLLDRAVNVKRSGDTRVTRNRGDATNIAGLCDRVPMALWIVAALLAEDPDRGLAEMATRLSDPRSRLKELRYNKTAVATAFGLSYRHLDPEHALLFRLLPVNPGPDIFIQSTAELAGVDQTAARHGLEALARAHLIQRSGKSGIYTRWRMHDLLSIFAEELSEVHADDDGREQARARLLDHYLHMARAAQSHVDPKRDVARLVGFTGRDDALAWLDAERPNLVAAATMATATGRDQVAWELPLALGHYLYWRGRFDDWLATLDISLTAARKLGDRGKEGEALRQRGWALQERRRFKEAIAVCKEAVEIFQHKEGGALTVLGHALRGEEEFGEASEAYKKAEAIYRETSDQRGLGIVRTNLGLALEGLRRPGEAITAHQDAVEIFREIGELHEEAAALVNLGGVLERAGRLEEAINACQAARTAYHKTGGKHGEATALTRLGSALHEAGRFEEAINACEDAAAICREISDLYGEGQALTRLGIACEKVDRRPDAITAYRAAAAIYEKTGDRDDERIALQRLQGVQG